MKEEMSEALIDGKLAKFQQAVANAEDNPNLINLRTMNDQSAKCHETLIVQAVLVSNAINDGQVRRFIPVSDEAISLTQGIKEGDKLASVLFRRRQNMQIYLTGGSGALRTAVESELKVKTKS